ncbi:sugar kinase [Streptomyces sp. NPDC056144]|uniref:sugar kinase n=1 Tax=Streptomyces sp. NPDC056144 TaxID=3345726 RepID=UPI0035DB665E
MVTFLPSRGGRLADVPSFTRTIGGAESNVACALAAAGHRVRWVGRVGRDGFGDHLVEAIGGYGVDVSGVGRDAGRPTGVYFRTDGERGEDGYEVAYYRAGSAASAMSVANVPYEAVGGARILHLSGITAALSADCLELTRDLVRARDGRPLVSFDVNYRPGLWRDAETAGEVLLELARGADVVFVGADEAGALWGVRDAIGVRALLPEPGVVVVKGGGEGAVSFERCVEPFERCAEQFPTPPLPETGGAAPGPPRLKRRRGWIFRPAGGNSARPAFEGTAARPYGGPGRSPDTPATPAFEARGPGQSPGSGRGGVGEEAPRSGPGGPGGLGGPGAPTRQGHRPDTVTPSPSPRVDVLAPTGAGDAFAAGFLHGVLRGLGPGERLRHGHLMAAAVLTVPGDLAEPPPRALADRLVALDDGAWGRLHLGPGWTGRGPHGPDQEVRTP